jgi:hypothetical protein
MERACEYFAGISEGLVLNLNHNRNPFFDIEKNDYEYDYD